MCRFGDDQKAIQTRLKASARSSSEVFSALSTKMSVKYMPFYVAEVQFAYNNNHFNLDIFETAIAGC